MKARTPEEVREWARGWRRERAQVNKVHVFSGLLEGPLILSFFHCVHTLVLSVERKELGSSRAERDRDEGRQGKAKKNKKKHKTQMRKARETKRQAGSQRQRHQAGNPLPPFPPFPPSLSLWFSLPWDSTFSALLILDVTTEEAGVNRFVRDS
ncbi:hypothetical protein B9Z19DRAFT_647750 [Tuber borchii]|uniref:Uncharacterized protein n=1 Tax=Tuber borchii TaxID=42251 RepID=A0A2T6ZAS8_TUBBO|nr:hypothetical protein B9Z19DRAFT_647750 [Tuber borchii]